MGDSKAIRPMLLIECLPSRISFMCSGFSGVTANFFPDPITWFYQHAKTDRKSHEDKLYRLSQAFSSAEAVVTRKV